DEALEGANRDRCVDLTAAADRLAGSGADAPADRRKRVRSAGHGVRFAKAPLRNQGHVLPRFRMNRTSLFAREVTLQPLLIVLGAAHGSLRDLEARLSRALHGDALRGRFQLRVPDLYRVRPVGDVFDVVRTVGSRYGEVRRRQHGY